MSVACPYCQNAIKLKGLKPGRFTPKCPKCAKVFLLTVSADPAMEPIASVREANPRPSNPTPEATVLHSVPPLSLGVTEVLPAAMNLSEKTEAFTPSAIPVSSDPTIGIPSSGEATEPIGATATDVGLPSADGETATMPPALGGYTLQKLLGKGGMGAVYLARQVSLDRDVALKVMDPRWAKDPAFLARFTREAYAAAQLVHHNIVQIYDIGEDHDIPFFSMEFVPGHNLADITRSKGKVDVEEAVGYALQAARGLKFAHDHGMVHRDIKPDNLMLNEQGIVKVADLGLVKTSSRAVADDAVPADGKPAAIAKPLSGLSAIPHVTNVGVAMGTPSYMAPEQGRNAASVDHRADIYSLGCTLYVLLTGRPPFEGKTALEVLTKHLTEPVVPPETFVKRVPKELSAILLKMLAKKPEDRYADLGGLIADLEKFLGVVSAGPFTPSEEHAAILDSVVKQFNNAPAAKQRRFVIPIFFGTIALLMFLCVVFRRPSWAAAVLGLGLMTMLGTFLTSGIIYRTHLFRKTREMVLDSHWTDWLKWSLGTVLFLVMLWLFGLVPILIALALLAAGLCSLYHILIERKLVEERAKALAKAEKLLKSLRLRGLEEETLRHFIAKYSGDRWEELYEALFGYDLLLRARQRLQTTEAGRRRPRHAPWRDPIIAWLETRPQAAREKRERRYLQRVEQKRLEAEGIGRTEAQSKAAAAADVMVDGAAQMKEETTALEKAPSAAPTVAMPAPPTKPLFNAKDLMAAAAKAEKEHAARLRPRGPGPIKRIYNFVLGPQPRFFVAIVLFAGFLLWLYQNQKVVDQVKEVADQALHQEQVIVDRQAWLEPKPLKLPGLPEQIGQLFSWFNPAVAAFILVMSGIWRSPRISLFFLPAAVVMVGGSLFGITGFSLPFVGSVTPEAVSLGLGLALAVMGIVFDRLLAGRAADPKRW